MPIWNMSAGSAPIVQEINERIYFDGVNFLNINSTALNWKTAVKTQTFKSYNVCLKIGLEVKAL